MARACHTFCSGKAPNAQKRKTSGSHSGIQALGGPETAAVEERLRLETLQPCKQDGMPRPHPKGYWCREPHCCSFPNYRGGWEYCRCRSDRHLHPQVLIWSVAWSISAVVIGHTLIEFSITWERLPAVLNIVLVVCRRVFTEGSTIKSIFNHLARKLESDGLIGIWMSALVYKREWRRKCVPVPMGQREPCRKIDSTLCWDRILRRIVISRNLFLLLWRSYIVESWSERSLSQFLVPEPAIYFSLRGAGMSHFGVRGKPCPRNIINSGF